MTRAVIARAWRGLALALSCVLVAACASSTNSSSTSREATPGSTPATAPDYSAATVPAGIGQANAIAAYRDYLARYPHSPEYYSVVRRLADLLLEQAADLQLAKATSPAAAARLETEAQQAYAAAASHYEYLLQKDPQGPQSTAVLYQLSRAYQES